MNNNVRTLLDQKIETCKANLINNKFLCDVCEDEKEVMELITPLLKDQVTCSVGGSTTLKEIGMLDYLENCKDIVYYDRYHTDDVHAVFRKAFSCDYYFMSSNAVTMDGHLYNIDGNGNRCAALTYGPKHVFVIVGENKIVKDLDAARKRVQEYAAPMNCVRLGYENPCTKVGYCMNCSESHRICDNELITRRDHMRRRIHVVIVKKDLGF